MGIIAVIIKYKIVNRIFIILRFFKKERQNNNCAEIYAIIIIITHILLLPILYSSVKTKFLYNMQIEIIKKIIIIWNIAENMSFDLM